MNSPASLFYFRVEAMSKQFFAFPPIPDLPTVGGSYDPTKIVAPIYSGDEADRPSIVYTDAGCIGVNPSWLGGTWAVIFADPDRGYREFYGHIVPQVLGRDQIENNALETLALCLGVEAASERATVYCDNENAIRRLTEPESQKFAHCPQWLITRCHGAKRCRPNVRIELIGGHPTKKDIERGRRPDGKRVSVYNVRADALCKLAARFARMKVVDEMRESEPADVGEPA